MVDALWYPEILGVIQLVLVVECEHDLASKLPHRKVIRLVQKTDYRQLDAQARLALIDAMEEKANLCAPDPKERV